MLPMGLLGTAGFALETTKAAAGRGGGGRGMREGAGGKGECMSRKHFSCIMGRSANTSAPPDEGPIAVHL